MNNNPPHVKHFILIDDRGESMNITYNQLTTNMVEHKWLVGVELDDGKKYFIKTIAMQTRVFYSIQEDKPITNAKEQ
jgi:hypothetical protein